MTFSATGFKLSEVPSVAVNVTETPVLATLYMVDVDLKIEPLRTDSRFRPIRDKVFSTVDTNATTSSHKGKALVR